MCEGGVRWVVGGLGSKPCEDLDLGVGTKECEHEVTTHP